MALMIEAPMPLPVSFGTMIAAAIPTAMWAAVLVAFVGLILSTSPLAQAAGPGCHTRVLENYLMASPCQYHALWRHPPQGNLTNFV